MKDTIITNNVDVFYENNHVLKNININISESSITALIGPSGCGKSTFLRIFNKMNNFITGYKISGEVYYKGNNINCYDDINIRKKIGMVFQKPNPFPKNIYENIAYGLKLHGIKNKEYIYENVKKSLIDVCLWNEVKDKLEQSALSLSGGQQQRLCIARCLIINPEVILMDEPTSALDPISTAKIEELLIQLKNKYTILIVTHNIQQAARISDKTAFFYFGNIIEYNDTKIIFTNPKEKHTENYIRGIFG